MRAGAGGGPLWALLFVAGAPWLGIEFFGWPIQPGHWAVALVMGLALVAGRRQLREEPLPLRGPLVLMGFLVGVALLRGEWEGALMMAGATVVNFLWGWGAWWLGREAKETGSLSRGVVLFLALCLGAELVLWIVRAAWPAGCYLVNCPDARLDLTAFRGGFHSSAQFALFLALLLPLWMPPVMLAWLDPRARRERIWPTALALACLVGLVAGAGPWWIALAAVTAAGLARLMLPWRDGRVRPFLRGFAVALIVVPGLFYVLFPDYAQRWFRPGGGSGGRVEIRYAGPVVTRLTSLEAQPVYIWITNEGPRSLPAPLAIVPRLLINHDGGVTRTYEGEATLLPIELAPGEKREVGVAVQLPHIAGRGYLAWRVEAGAGLPLALTEASDGGFRFVNTGYAPLTTEPENLLSALASRARDFGRYTYVPEPGRPAGSSAESVLGSALDALFFSPLWGESKGNLGTPPFPEARPLLPAMMARYGLIGLLLLLWLGWSVARRADEIGARSSGPAARLSWQLVPLSVLLVATLSLFSGVAATFHAQWGLFLLFGFVEGRMERVAPARQGEWLPLIPRVNLRLPRLWPARRGTPPLTSPRRPRIGLRIRMRWPRLRLFPARRRPARPPLRAPPRPSTLRRWAFWRWPFRPGGRAKHRAPAVPPRRRGWWPFRRRGRGLVRRR